MCDVCNATTLMYSVDPATLCDEHYFEWAEEKMYNDFDMSTEGVYL